MTDSTDNALKPCPFCGSHGIDRDTYWHRDYCTNCGGKGPAAGNSVKAGWNTRADLAPDPMADPRVVALVETAKWARNRLETIADENWRGDARDFKRSIVGVFADFDAALAALSPTGGNADG